MSSAHSAAVVSAKKGDVEAIRKLLQRNDVKEWLNKGDYVSRLKNNTRKTNMNHNDGYYRVEGLLFIMRVLMVTWKWRSFWNLQEQMSIVLLQ